MKNHFLDAPIRDLNNAAPPAGQTASIQKASTCKCCGWKGKVQETRKNYIFLNTISEIELFCPACSTYLGFITDQK